MVRRKFVILVVTLLFTFMVAAGALAAPKAVPPGQEKVPPGQARERVEVEAEQGVQAGEAVQERDREREEATGQAPAGQVKKEVKAKTQIRARVLTPEEKARLQARPPEERLKIRGMNLKFDVPPVIKYGRTLVPVRAISQGLGAEVDWDPETMMVTITRGDTVIELVLGDREMLVNGEVVTMDVPAQLISNRTFVPIRFIAAALGERVSYDEETGDIDIGESEEEATEEDGEDEEDEEEVEEEEEADGAASGTTEQSIRVVPVS